MLFRLIRTSKRPRIYDAHILEITREPYEYTSNFSQRKVPHAKVEYYHQSIKHEKKILLKSKSKAGDTISLFINGNEPGAVEQFHPMREIIALSILLLIGASMVIAGVLAMNYFD